MRPGAKNTQRLGENLAVGFSVDKIIATLVRTERLGDLQLDDRSVIEDAVAILQETLRGEKWVHFQIRNIYLDRQSVNQLIEITNSLLEKGAVEREEFQSLLDFFTAYSRALLDKARSVIFN